jgi:hypothetical protein
MATLRVLKWQSEVAGLIISKWPERKQQARLKNRAGLLGQRMLAPSNDDKISQPEHPPLYRQPPLSRTDKPRPEVWAPGAVWWGFDSGGGGDGFGFGGGGTAEVADDAADLPGLGEGAADFGFAEAQDEAVHLF